MPYVWRLGPILSPAFGHLCTLVKPSLVHTWSNVLSWIKVPKDLFISQIPTPEVGSSRLETLSRSLTLAVTLALGSARERFTAPAPAGTSLGRPS